MATLPTSKDQEDEQLNQDLESMAPQLGSGSIPGGLQTGQSWSAAGNRSGSKPGGIGYVGLDRYLAANKPAADRFGAQVTGLVQGAGEQARGALSTGLQGFGQSVDQGTVRDQGINARIGSDILGIAGNQADTAQLVKQRDAQYQGPNQLEETSQYNDISRALGGARETSELAKSESGITQLSNKAVTGQRTRGGAALDTNLLLSDQGTRSNIEGARKGLDTLDSELASTSKSAQEKALAGRAATEQTRTQTRGALTSATDALDKALQEKTDRTRLEAQQRATQAQMALGGANSGALGAIPTAGAAGRYYENNDPTRGSYQDKAAVGGQGSAADINALNQYWATPQGKAAFEAALKTQQGQRQFAAGMAARDVPEFIHGGSGQSAIPGFQQFLAQNKAGPLGGNVLADLGLTDQDFADLTNLDPVGQMAASAASGTNNVNPYAYLESFRDQMGGLDRFATVQDPNVTIQRENAASADDYNRSEALKMLSADLGRTLLDPSQRANAGTASTDIVDFDAGGAAQARAAALDELARRTGVHVAGNARSGSDSFVKKYVQPGRPGSVLELLKG